MLFDLLQRMRQFEYNGGTKWSNHADTIECRQFLSSHSSFICTVGIPQPFRGLVWQMLCGAHNTGVKSLYTDFMKQSSPCEKLIRRDIARTYPEHEFFRCADPSRHYRNVHEFVSFCWFWFCFLFCFCFCFCFCFFIFVLCFCFAFAFAFVVLQKDHQSQH